MIFKLFGVLQFILIQVISAQTSTRDLSSQNVLNNLANMPLVGYDRSRRQINNPSVGLPGNGNLPANSCTNGLPLKNSMTNGNFLRANGLPNNFALKNGLTNNFALNNELPNNSPLNFPFPNVNEPQNKLLPSFNDIINNALPFNNVPNGLPAFNNGFPNGLPDFNNVPNGLPGINNVPNGLPGINNVPNGLPGINNVPNGLPGINNVPNGLPGINNVPNGLLPNFNNVPSGFPGFNNVPSGLPGFNYAPNELPGLNNVPNGLPNYNNVPTGLPRFNNVPNVLPGLNNLPSLYEGPNRSPSLNEMPNRMPNFNNNPFTNQVLNLKNLQTANTLPNLNNEFSCGNTFPPLPVRKGLPLNNLSSGNILPPNNNQLQYLNNFRITEIGIQNGVPDLRIGNNISPNTNNVQNVNVLGQKVSDEFAHINNYQNVNGIIGTSNMPSANAPTILPIDSRFPSVNYFPINNGMSNIASEEQNIINLQLNNNRLPVSYLKNYNALPVNDQRFVNNFPFNNDFAVINSFPAYTESRLLNAMDNGMPHSNGGHTNDILIAKRGLPETCSQNSDASRFSRNDIQFGNIQVPVSNWQYDFIPAKMPVDQSLLIPEGMQMFSNVPNDYTSVFTSNNLNLAQELVKNLQIEGMANMPFLNGLPVAGITETVTVLNGPLLNNM